MRMQALPPVILGAAYLVLAVAAVVRNDMLGVFVACGGLGLAAVSIADGRGDRRAIAALHRTVDAQQRTITAQDTRLERIHRR